MALATAKVVEIGRGRLMAQVRRVESCCVAKAQTLFLITTVLIRKYEDVCLALSTSALSFPTISIKYQLPYSFNVSLAFQYVAQNGSGKTLCITVLL